MNTEWSVETPADPEVLRDDHEFAGFAAASAGSLLLRLRESAGHGEELKRAGDGGSHELLLRLLAEYRPHDAVLSEEGHDDERRLAAERVWIVDPVDGTREYAEPPRDDWAVHVALCQAGELTAGAVALPALGETFTTKKVPAIGLQAGERPRLAVSRTRPPEFVTSLAEQLGAETVPMGSAGAKVLAVVRGVVDAYVHAGGQYEWDSAAPVAVARAAGLHTSRIDGGPLRYNQPDPMLPDLLVCRPELTEHIISAL